MNKLERIAELLEKHEKSFYLVVSALATLAVLGSVLLARSQGLVPRTLSALLLNISAALLVLAVVYWLRSVFFVHRDRVEIDTWMSEIRERLDRLGADVTLGQSYLLSREYYEAYYEQVSTARTSVYLIGDGFSCHTEENRRKALALFNSMKTALDNGALVKRFQFQNTLSLEWLKLMIRLKDKYQERFSLLMNPELDPKVVPFVLCLADHGGPTASVNLMFTISSDTTLGSRLGGPGFLFRDATALEGSVFAAFRDYFDLSWSKSERDLRSLLSRLEIARRDRVDTALDSNEVEPSLDQTGLSQIGQRLDIIDLDLIHSQVVRYLKSRGEIYFAYGSNLLAGRIGRRVQSAEYLARATLSDYEMRFNMMGTSGEGQGGGIGNLVSSPDAQVPGILYWLSEEDFSKLANIESAMGYQVEYLDVCASTDKRVEAAVFLGPGEGEEFKPTDEYWRLFSNGLKERGIGKSYHDEIEERLFGGGI